MDWIIGLLLLVVGGIIGFFAAKYVLGSSQAKQPQKPDEQTLKEVMAQQAASHLSQSRQVIDTLQEQCNLLANQLDAYEELLRSEEGEDGQQRLSYFGEHAAVFIRNQQKPQRTKRAAAEYQPKDFPDQSSGLFDGSKNQQVVDGER